MQTHRREHKAGEPREVLSLIGSGPSDGEEPSSDGVVLPSDRRDRREARDRRELKEAEGVSVGASERVSGDDGAAEEGRPRPVDRQVQRRRSQARRGPS